MRNVKVVVEYDGTDYFGFQRQADAPTVQEELERVLGKIVKKKVTVYGSGRTDTGVHAEGQVINFKTECSIPVEKLCIAMNSFLPKDIAAVEAEEVDMQFHARYSAKKRLYRYNILNRVNKSAFEGRYSWHVPMELDVEAMREGARWLVGIHNFTSFSCADRYDGSPVRNLMLLDVRRDRELVIIEVRASAFLRSMVRVIVGTLVDVGIGKMDSSKVRDVLLAEDRRFAGKTAPPQGLCLVEVEY